MERYRRLLGKNISKWYKTFGRKNLPWRKKVTPNRVWISEMILQQTQVATGIDYFLKFTEKYPDLESIKFASEDDILRLWKGLGYYRRATYIYQAKEIIHNKLSGKFPEKFDSIMSLPGVGRSTAGAILSIAFKKPYPILDGNVKRVLSRFYFQKIFNEKIFWILSEQMLDKIDPFSFQQGIMDIGATICKKQNPDCRVCPLKKSCKSNIMNDYFNLPTKRAKKKSLHLNFKIHYKENKIFLIKDNALGFWKNLWMPPYEVCKNNNYDIKHKLSHRDLFIEFKSEEKVDQFENGQWFEKEKLQFIATPKPISDKLLKL